MNEEIFQQLLLAVALAVVSVIGFGLRSLVQVGIEYLRSRIGETAFQRVRGYADVVVKTLEQTPVFKDFEGDKKKELAILAVLKFAEDNRLPIDRELVDKFIEAAVLEMNAQIGKIEWEMVGGEAPALAGLAA